MPLNSGEIFAGFRIIRLLGSGGMGEVYLAQHPRLPRRDALKVLPADVSADAEYRARFNREADLASTLYHPHIVGVHDRGEYDGQLWISMDFVDGLDAARLLASRFPAGMPTDQVVRIVTAVAGALDYAHKQGLLHRDVKPANIMLTHLDDDGEQRILLADFGIARNIDDISGLTTTNMTVGTVAYSAPEQLMGEEIDGRADQYALAATAYHLLTGSQLFPHSNPAVVISRHLNSPPPALADTRPELAALDPVLGSGARQGRRRPLRSLRGLRTRTGRASIARGELQHGTYNTCSGKSQSSLSCPRTRCTRSRRRFSQAVAYPGSCAWRSRAGKRGRAGVASVATAGSSTSANIKLSASSGCLIDRPPDEQRGSAPSTSDRDPCAVTPADQLNRDDYCPTHQRSRSGGTGSSLRPE